MPPRPPHPIPTFGDDGQRPFLGDRMAGLLKVICPTMKSEILPVGLFCRSPSGSAPSPVVKPGTPRPPCTSVVSAKCLFHRSRHSAKAEYPVIAGVREPPGPVRGRDRRVARRVDECNPNRGRQRAEPCLKPSTAGEQCPLLGGITEVGFRSLQGCFLTHERTLRHRTSNCPRNDNGRYDVCHHAINKRVTAAVPA